MYISSENIFYQNSNLKWMGEMVKYRHKKLRRSRGLNFYGKYFPMEYTFSGVFLHADSEYHAYFT